MIAYQCSYQGQVTKIENSKGLSFESNHLQSLLNFLLEPYPNEFKVVWNLEEFLAPILKKLNPPEIKRLCQSGKVSLRDSGHTLIYNYKQSLYLSMGCYRTRIYPLRQFFNGEGPQTLEDIKVLGEQLLQELEEIGIKPHRLSSAVAIIDDLLEEVDYPSYETLPDKVGQLAWECCDKPWVEAHQLGHWNMAYDYDIISSFPSACAELLDLRYGDWVEDKAIPDNAYYGFARGSVAIKGRVNPIVYTNGAGNLFNPNGKWPTPISLHEIKFIEAFGIGKFAVEEGVWWIPSGKEVKPFKELVERLYGYRQNSKLLNKVMKGGMVGIAGKFLQRIKNGRRFAPSFNPVYGAMSQIPSRLKVASFILSNHLEDSLIHISTDGCLLDEKVDLVSDEKMGSWRLDSSGPALVVSSGCLFYGDKRPNQITYPEAMEMIGKRPGDSSWEKSSKRLFTIGDVIENGGLEKIGSERKIVVGFGLKNEHDRDFPELPYDGVSLLAKHYQSEPLKVSKLSKPAKPQS